jgi:predicted MFS family arabinose efflux permease
MPEDAPVYAPLSGENRSSDAPDSNSNAAPDDGQPAAAEESTVSEASKKQQQRRYYWTMALLNLLETGAAAGVSKFTPLFLAARGLDVAQVGVVLAVAQVCRFLGGLVFGRVADRTGRFRGVLLWTNLISVALALSTTSLLSPWHGMHGWKRVLVLALLTDGYAFFTSRSVRKPSPSTRCPLDGFTCRSRTGRRRARS